MDLASLKQVCGSPASDMALVAKTDSLAGKVRCAIFLDSYQNRDRLAVLRDEVDRLRQVRRGTWLDTLADVEMGSSLAGIAKLDWRRFAEHAG